MNCALDIEWNELKLFLLNIATTQQVKLPAFFLFASLGFKQLYKKRLRHRFLPQNFVKIFCKRLFVISTWRKGCFYAIYYSSTWLHYVWSKKTWFVNEFNKIFRKWIFCLNFQESNFQIVAFLIVEFYWRSSLMFDNSWRISLDLLSIRSVFWNFWNFETWSFVIHNFLLKKVE